MKRKNTLPRRDFLKTAAIVAAPMFVPARLFGQESPSNIIRVAQIGCGRIGRTSEIPGMIHNSDICRVVALCDLDSLRLDDAKNHVDAEYAKKTGKSDYKDTKTFHDYQEMLQDPSIDAVCVSTPDHWHAQQAVEAALAKKDIYVQKPTSLTIVEGRQMADAVKKTGRILQLGSQQRSDPQFRLACELTRNGKIGKIKEIHIGLPTDPPGGKTEEMPVPKNLDYDRWIGSTPLVYYTLDRVHPQGKDGKPDIYNRPGWLRCEQFGAGMITGWGTHHVDIGHWGMGLELSGPTEITGTAIFPASGSGLWDVHGTYEIAAKYANGAVMYISDKKPNGIKFVGENGWIWVTRGSFVPGSNDPQQIQRNKAAIDASDPNILTQKFSDSDERLHASPRNDHHRDWLVSIKERTEPVAPVEQGHRSCSACLLAHIAMKLKRTVHWNPAEEKFNNDPEATAMLARTQRKPYGTEYVIQ